MNALHKRIITAALLLPLVLALIFYTSSPIFSVVTGIVMLLAVGEWVKLISLSRLMSAIYLAMFALAMVLNQYISDTWVLVAAGVFWLFAFVPVVIYKGQKPKWANCKHVLSLLGVFIIYPTWVAMNMIHASSFGSWVLISLFLIVWSVDTGAFFAGRKFGKHKLMPHVSPGKTWEGVLGGLGLGFMVTAGIYFGFQSWVPNDAIPQIIQNVPVLFGVSFLVMVISILGDLFESLIKRIQNVKDSGQLLPGHGGILDRIDSLTAAMPIFALAMGLFKG